MTEITCHRCLELLIDYVTREMSEEDLAVLDAHFEHCPPCLVYLNSYKVTITVTRQLPREAPIPPELEERLLAALKDVRPECGGAMS